MTPALCTNYRDKSERKSRKDGDGGLETGVGGWDSMPRNDTSRIPYKERDTIIRAA
jgi:hypothetical protein